MKGNLPSQGLWRDESGSGGGGEILETRSAVAEDAWAGQAPRFPRRLRLRSRMVARGTGGWKAVLTTDDAEGTDGTGSVSSGKSVLSVVK